MSRLVRTSVTRSNAPPVKRPWSWTQPPPPPVQILEDATSPTPVTSTTNVATTASFTPVANSLIVAVAVCGNDTVTGTLTAPVTDSLGSTWTLLRRANAANHGSAEVWAMDAGASPAARTVTVTGTGGAQAIGTALTVKVLTNAQSVKNCLAASNTLVPTTEYASLLTTTRPGSLVCGGLVGIVSSGSLTPNGLTTAWQTVSDATNGMRYGTFRRTDLVSTPSGSIYGFSEATGQSQAIVVVEIMAAGLQVHTSTPAQAYQDITSTTTTASFTPPAGSMLLVWARYNTGSGNTPTDPTITDSLGTHLTYTLLAHCKNPDVNNADGAVAVWSAPVTTSAAMTVSVTETDAATGLGVLAQVWVHETGQATTGAVVENASNVTTTSVAQGFTATANKSRGVLGFEDWGSSGTPSAGTDCTLIGGDTALASPTMAFACCNRSLADGVTGLTTTMRLNHGSTADTRWIAVEVVPPSGTAPSAVTIDPATGAWAAQVVAPVPQPVALTATPAAGTWSAIALALAPGPTAVTITPATTTWAAQTVAAVAQVSLTPAIATWTAQPVVSTPAVGLTPATSVWAAQTVAPAPGQVALTITPATGSWSAIAVTPTPGQTARTLTAATGTWTAVPVSPVPGATAVTLTPATATWTAQQAALSTPGALGALPAVTTWTAVPVSPVPGSVAVTLTPATATWSAVPVTAQPGMALSTALSTWTARPVAPVPGQVAVALTPAGLTWTARPMGVPVAVALTPAGSTWNAVPMALAGAGEPGYIAGTTRKAGRVGGTTTAAGGAYTTGGARIDGNAATAGRVDGNVL